MDPFTNNQYYQKILQYFYAKKDSEYQLFSPEETNTKTCQLSVSLPDIPEFTYGVMLNGKKNLSDNHIVIWDVFYTGQFYVSSEVYNSITHFKGLFPVFYIHNLNNQTTGVFDPSLGVSSPDSPLAQDIGDKTFIYYRYKDDNYNGWAFTWTTLFSSKEFDFTEFLDSNEDNSQLELPFEVDTNLDVNNISQDTLSKLFSQDILAKLSQDVAMSDEKLSKLIKTIKVSKQAKNLLSQIDELSSDSQSSSSCICSNFTCVSKSSSINIVSKDHAFANAPEGFSFCSHKDATKSFNGTVAVCSWPTNSQSRCALYNPKTELVERRNSSDAFGNLLYDFEVSLNTLSNFDNVILIKNMINNEVVNTITYPTNAKKEDVIAESIRILDDLILAWTDLSEENKNTIIPQVESKPKKQSYILSLV
jgi:hypothetical protein